MVPYVCESRPGGPNTPSHDPPRLFARKPVGRFQSGRSERRLPNARSEAGKGTNESNEEIATRPRFFRRGALRSVEERKRGGTSRNSFLEFPAGEGVWIHEEESEERSSCGRMRLRASSISASRNRLW